MLLKKLPSAFLIGLLSAGFAPAAEPTHKLPESLKAKFFGMRGFPEVKEGVDLATFFPMIDDFGQYRHKEWPGKTKSAEDFARHKDEETADMAKHPGPEGWDHFGGWKAGPQLLPTGRFRTEKQGDRWWLVDPEGRLFWSQGIDCVGSQQGVTPITDRESWFAGLPAHDGPFGLFYGKASWAPHGYYQNKSYATYNFSGANLMRKYGAAWPQQSAEIAHRRLRSWGLNTIGNWSAPEIYRLRKTPYVVNLKSGGKPLEGSQGYWGKFPDVFDPGFERAVREGVVRHKDDWAEDAWCLGCFIDNELSWGDEMSLAMAALQSPPSQAAKQVFLADLKKKYDAIERLNEAWDTKHTSWDALAESRTAPDKKKAHDDLAAFATRTVEQYFRTCRDAVKAVAPQALYLGCRFAWTNDRAVRAAAAKYCDVLSFNYYRRSVADVRMPEGVDKPVIIGEFHFGALDRGMFHTGLVATESQQERADLYKKYVNGALANPIIVGAHWFQFGDQATTGRGDGENYQIGFVDICDTPYPETIQAAREVGDGMYSLRGKD